MTAGDVRKLALVEYYARKKLGLVWYIAEDMWDSDRERAVRAMADVLVSTARTVPGVTVRRSEVVFAPAERIERAGYETRWQRLVRWLRRRPVPLHVDYMIRARVLVWVPVVE